MTEANDGKVLYSLVASGIQERGISHVKQAQSI